jgi:hypothetical protein
MLRRSRRIDKSRGRVRLTQARPLQGDGLCRVAAARERAEGARWPTFNN